MSLFGEIHHWCRGRHWPARALFLAWLVWLGLRCTGDRRFHTIFDGINLGIHEGGHVMFSPFGRFLYVAGGTITQLAAPIAAAFILRRQGDWFGVGATGVWLATNCFGVAVYSADARSQALPLVTIGGGEASHDWTYMLGRLGWLRHDQLVAGLFRVAGIGILWSSLAFMAWLVLTMIRSPERIPERPRRAIVRDLPRSAPAAQPAGVRTDPDQPR